MGRASDLASALSAINAPDFKKHIDVLADEAMQGREAGSRGGIAASEYLAGQFAQHRLRGAGDDGGYLQFFRGTCRNVLGLLEGSDPALKKEFILVGAHFDHVGRGWATAALGPAGQVHPGADDNASGVAGVLELQEALLALSPPPKRSVLFALWDGEEKGLWGSRHWLSHPTAPLAQVKLAMNLDMIGRLAHQTVSVYGTRTSTGLRRLVSERNTTAGLFLDFPWDIKPNSDHHPFFTQRIPVLMLHGGLHDDFHRASDTPDKIDHAGAERVTRLAFAVLLATANADTPRVFRPASAEESDTDRRQLEEPLPPAPPRLGVTWKTPAAGERGFLLTHVLDGSAAAHAGLQPGDRLMKFAGREVTDEQQVKRSVLAATAPVAVVVERSGQVMERQVELAGAPVRWGLSWRSDEAEPGTFIVVQVVPGSLAHAAGLQPGDRIYRVNGQDFRNDAEFSRRLATAVGPVALRVERRGRTSTVTLSEMRAEPQR